MTDNNHKILTFPSGYFTISDLHAQDNHRDMVEITLRFKVTQSVKEKKISCIGTTKRAVGRPQMVFTMNPILNKTLIEAQAAGVQLSNQYQLQAVEALNIRNNATRKELESTESEVETTEVETTINA